MLSFILRRDPATSKRRVSMLNQSSRKRVSLDARTYPHVFAGCTVIAATNPKGKFDPEEVATLFASCVLCTRAKHVLASENDRGEGKR